MSGDTVPYRYGTYDEAVMGRDGERLNLVEQFLTLQKGKRQCDSSCGQFHRIDKYSIVMKEALHNMCLAQRRPRCPSDNRYDRFQRTVFFLSVYSLLCLQSKRLLSN